MNRWARPFPICTQLPGPFDRAYVNCKLRDHTGRRSVRSAKRTNRTTTIVLDGTWKPVQPEMVAGAFRRYPLRIVL